MFNLFVTQIVFKASISDIGIMVAIVGCIAIIYNTFNDKKMEQKKNSFNLKDIVWFSTLLIGMSGSYFGMKAKVDNIERQLNVTAKIVNDNNLELLRYKIDELQKTQNESSKKIDDLTIAVTQFIRDNSGK